MVTVKCATRRLVSERGAELIEFALVVPILLFILLGIADFGFMFQRYEVLTNAAREGARIAVLPGYGVNDVRARVCSYLQSGGVPATGCPNPSNPVVTVTNVTVPVSGGAALQARQVQVTYTHNYMFVGGVAGLLTGSFSTTVPITARAVMRSELVATP
jgi:Flp pilus assembly protein TadG